MVLIKGFGRASSGFRFRSSNRVGPSSGISTLSIRDRVQSGTGDEGWAIHTDSSLRSKVRIVVPQLTDLREEILREFHFSRFAMHLGGTKMYRDLRC